MFRLLRIGLTIMVLATVLAACSGHQTPTAILPIATQTPQGVSSQIDAYLSNLTNEHKFSGSVLVVRSSKILFSEGYGMADIENTIPNNPQTRFLIGSMGKQFTAMAILMLQAQGKLNVQDHACQYIPECPTSWQEITIHRLLTHTSGISDFPSDITIYTSNTDVPLSPVEIITLYKNKPLLFKPGETFAYSSPGYILLDYIVEQVSGQSYGIFLQQQIFEPLKMNNSGYDCHNSKLAVGYETFGTRARLINWPITYSVCTTVEDLYRWDQALYTTQLISKELLDKMFTPYVPTPSYGDMEYGYGWFIGEWLNRHVEGHGGWIPGSGFRSFIQRYPNDGISIIVLSNQEYSDVFTITTEIAQMVFEKSNTQNSLSIQE
jgi:CubicO group peptidase (beta-lactamase class C family)